MDNNLTQESVLAYIKEISILIDKNTKLADKNAQTFAEEMKELKEAQLKTGEQLKEAQLKTELAQQKTDELIKKLGKKIGDLSNTFGEFNENLFFNSLKNLMINKFKIQFFETNAHRNLSGYGGIEIDALGIINGNVNSLYLTEIKTKFSEKAIKQLQNTIYKFDRFYPELADKKKYGLIAIPYLKEHEKEAIIENGFYPISINGDIAEIQAPSDFTPKEF